MAADIVPHEVALEGEGGEIDVVDGIAFRFAAHLQSRQFFGGQCRAHDMRLVLGALLAESISVVLVQKAFGVMLAASGVKTLFAKVKK